MLSRGRTDFRLDATKDTGMKGDNSRRMASDTDNNQLDLMREGEKERDRNLSQKLN